MKICKLQEMKIKEKEKTQKIQLKMGNKCVSTMLLFLFNIMLATFAILIKVFVEKKNMFSQQKALSH